MRRSCPNCKLNSNSKHLGPKIVGYGSYYRRSDSKRVRRFLCLHCRKSFSCSTKSKCRGQKKRWANEWVRRLLCSGVSQRRIAKILCINRITVVRKLLYLQAHAELKLEQMNSKLSRLKQIEFDDMETFEHTKCKPLSITLAVESHTRRILGLEVCQMPAKGKLAHISRKKYGRRSDHRPKARAQLFSRLQAIVHPQATIKSDENPHYRTDVKRFFSECVHEVHKGQRGCVAGQGELKKVGFDPLFSLNHTCAKLRADINRLVRRTWCTTKKPERLRAHLAVYAHYHNQHLILS
jgi:transposase-like protein